MIFYAPPESWHSSSVICSVCLNPDTRDAFQSTYHDGTHAPPAPDNDDLVKNGGGKGSQGGNTKGDGDDGDKPQTTTRAQAKRASTVVPESVERRIDPDDPGFVDASVSAYFNFTG
jgi:hypothetical protein